MCFQPLKKKKGITLKNKIKSLLVTFGDLPEFLRKYGVEETARRKIRITLNAGYLNVYRCLEEVCPFSLTHATRNIFTLFRAGQNTFIRLHECYLSIGKDKE